MSDDSLKPEKPEKPEPFIEQIKDGGKKLILSFGPAGLALGLAVHFARLGQWRLAGFCFVGAGVLAIGSKFYKALDPKIDKLFEWLVSNFEGWVLRSWWTITSNFRGKYYQQLIFDCRDYRTQGLKTKGAFTLDLEKVFVPLQVAPESAENISSDMMRVKASEHCLGIWDFLAERSRQPSYQRIAIIAPPGAGKTTLLEHLTLTYAQQAQRRQHRKAPVLIPVLLYLRTVREEVSVENPPSLATVIENRPEIKKLNPKGWFENQLHRGKCLVLLDGLDEVADEGQRKKVSRWVDQQIQAYPKSCFILTSRPFGYKNAALERIGTVVEVQPFSLKQMQQFIGNWYLQNEMKSRLGKDDVGVRQVANQKANDLIDRIQNSSPLAKMALNPLLLTMIATVHCYRGALPGRRVELYGEICDVLLGRRQDAKGISDSLTATQKRAVLQVLALALMQRNTREFSPKLGCELIRDKLRMMMGNTMQPTTFLETIVNQAGLLIEREKSLYEFAHNSFQEYLAAGEVKETSQENLLIQKVNEGWWAETIRLYASQQDVTHLIQAAQAEGSVAALTLAFECLEEGLSVHPKVRKALEDKLEGGLEAADPELFRLAAEVKLSRRLNRLLRIDDDREIDMDYITCAEYQLFIDAQKKLDIHRQPDHWLTYRFAPGNANTPITGVRGSDAEEFCQWLSKKSEKLYRLPQPREVLEHPSPRKNIGSWCMKQRLKRVEGIALEQKNLWQEDWVTKIVRIRAIDRTNAQVKASTLALALAVALKLKLDLDIARDRDINLKPNLDIDLDFEIARDLALKLNPVRTSALDLALKRHNDNDYDYDPNLNYDLNLGFDLNRARAIALTIARSHAQDRYQAQNFNREIDRVRNIVLDLNLDLDFDRNLKVDKTLLFDQLRTTLLLVTTFWNLMSQAYEKGTSGFQAIIPVQRQTYQSRSLNYKNNRDQALKIYSFFVLLKLRQSGEMPTWEGIRIVRERNKA
jgi:NACHT domain/Sulfatase-modifying factor enzyme 1